MSVELVRSEIRRFLASSKVEVLCLHGKWGVGKTHAWANELGRAQKDAKISSDRYSYVSLFGLNTLNDVKAAIFENTMVVGEGELKADLRTLEAFVNREVGAWRKITRHVRNVPIVKPIIGEELGQELSFLAIRNQLICFDDLERRGRKLEIGEVLGLCSLLREQRDCKIILLLNDEQLNDKDDEFGRYLEKVVDVSLTYEPTAAECASIARTWSSPVSERCAELSQNLGITNLRILRKIDRALELLRPIVATLDEEVFTQASASLALFVWSVGQPDDAPSIEFLTRKKAEERYGQGDVEQWSDEEKTWNALLEHYGYVWTDEFDLELINGARRGYFDPEKILQHARRLEERIIAGRAQGSFREAWNRYRESFEDNQDEVLDGLFASFMSNVRQVTPMNLDGIVRLFKDLGRGAQAAELITSYVKERSDEDKLFDLSEYVLDEVRDDDVKKAFAAHFTVARKPADLSEILASLKDGWSDDVLSAAASATVDDYRRAFKEARGASLRRMIYGALQFNRIVNATPHMRRVAELATHALTLIAQESPINAERVARYGVNEPAGGA